MSTRVLFLTAGFGEGHNAAARALAAATEDIHGPGTARVVDVFALARPRFNQLARRGYLTLINRAPGAWRLAYGWLDRSPRAARAFTFLRRETRVLAELIEREAPEALCSTYPLYAYMLADLERRTRRRLPRHVNVVTDSITINSLWWRARCDRWFVPNPESAEVLIRAGVPPGRITASGFPVAPLFADAQPRLAPPPLPGGRPRILYIINSGTRGAAECARRLLANEDWDVTCTVGRDAALLAELQAAAARRRHPAVVLGWTQELPRLLMTHHVVVSKAGGATTQEAIAARCPMLVNQIIPGQEEGNYELLRRHAVGALARTPDEIAAALDRAFSNGAAEWHRWRTALDRITRPNAAREIVTRLLPPHRRRAASASFRAPHFNP